MLHVPPCVLHALPYGLCPGMMHILAAIVVNVQHLCGGCTFPTVLSALRVPTCPASPCYLLIVRSIHGCLPKKVCVRTETNGVWWVNVCWGMRRGCGEGDAQHRRAGEREGGCRRAQAEGQGQEGEGGAAVQAQARQEGAQRERQEAKSVALVFCMLLPIPCFPCRAGIAAVSDGRRDCIVMSRLRNAKCDTGVPHSSCRMIHCLRCRVLQRLPPPRLYGIARFLRESQSHLIGIRLRLLSCPGC